MKYSIYLIIRKVTAWIMSVLATLGILGGDTQQDADIQRGEENSISAYDKSNADYTLSIDAANEVHDISELLYGVFFEDINFAADGGVYAEKVINRSFEYCEPKYFEIIATIESASFLIPILLKIHMSFLFHKAHLPL